MSIVDGKTGKSLWQLVTSSEEMSSDLVLRTAEKNRDVFVFRIQGRSNPEATAHKSKIETTTSKPTSAKKTRGNKKKVRSK